MCKDRGAGTSPQWQSQRPIFTQSKLRPWLPLLKFRPYNLLEKEIEHIMSDDEADPELLELLRQHLQGKLHIEEEADTGVLESAEFVYDNGIDVAIDMRATKSTADTI